MIIKTNNKKSPIKINNPNIMLNENDKKTVGRINNSGLSQTRKGAMKKKIKRREKA